MRVQFRTAVHPRKIYFSPQFNMTCVAEEVRQLQYRLPNGEWKDVPEVTREVKGKK